MQDGGRARRSSLESLFLSLPFDETVREKSRGRFESLFPRGHDTNQAPGGGGPTRSQCRANLVHSLKMPNSKARKHADMMEMMRAGREDFDDGIQQSK